MITVTFRIILIIIVACAVVWMFRQINASRMKVSAALFWIMMSFILILLALFPDIMKVFSKVLGVYSDTNLLFAVILFLLLIRTFLNSLEISRLENRLEELVRQNALLEKRHQEEKEAQSSLTAADEKTAGRTE